MPPFESSVELSPSLVSFESAHTGLTTWLQIEIDNMVVKYEIDNTSVIS